MPKYKDIKELFKIEKIQNEYILAKLNKNSERIFIYKIKPVLFLDLSDNVQKNIIEVYRQFLSECKFKIQILISNNKLDVNKYVDEFLCSNDKLQAEIFEEYIADMKNKLIDENIYETSILVIVSENSKESTNVQEYDRVIYKLEDIGCRVSKIDNKNEIEKILYKHLNKV